MNQPPFMTQMPGQVPGQVPGQPVQQPPYGAPTPFAGPPGASPPAGPPPFSAPPGAPPAAPTFGPPPGGMPGSAPAAPAPQAAPAAAALPAWFHQVPAVASAPQFGSGGPGVSMGAAFGRIASANLTGDGNYLRDGRYVVAIKNLLWEPRYTGQTLIAELIVVESIAQPGMYVANGLPVQPGTPGAVPAVPQAPGEQASFTCQPDNANNPNAKAQGLAFLLALFGIDLATLRAAQADATPRNAWYKGQGYTDINMPEDGRDPLDVLTARCVAPQQPGRGMLLMVATNRKVSQGRFKAENKGKILVLPTFSHIACSAEDIAKRRALIDAAQPIPATNLLQPAVLPSAPAAVPFGAGPAPYAPVPNAGPAPLPMPATYPGGPSFGVPQGQ